MQSLYFLRLQADRCIAPAEADVRMMAFGLSEFTNLLDKGPCFAKVAEPEGPLDTMSVVAEFCRARGAPRRLSGALRAVPANVGGFWALLAVDLDVDKTLVHDAGDVWSAMSQEPTA